MKKLFTFLFLTITINSSCQSLAGSKWCFGDSTGLDFASGTPTQFASSLKSLEGCASISDSRGNLLFYTNGISVWDRNDNQMPNGFGLYSVPELTFDYGSSATNGCIILPFPNDPFKFYIFTVASFAKDTGMHYSVVNLQLNSGNGDVELKNFHLLHGKLCESIAAVRHANGRDWWVITHKNGTNTFYWFLINTYGVSGPFIQTIGYNLNFGGAFQGGEIDVTKDGTKLLMVTQKSIEVFFIDRCEGKFTDSIPIFNTNILYSAYSGSFSPNGNLIYVTANNDSLFQYNLSDPVDSIYLNRILINNNPFYDPLNANTQHPLSQLQLGIDDKLYFGFPYGAYPSQIFDTINTKLNCINNPDNIGAACNLQLGVISLGSRRTFYGLPNIPNYNLSALDNSECDTLGLSINDVKTINHNSTAYPNPVSNGNICFHLPANGEKQVTVTVTDPAGRTCFSKSITTDNACVQLPGSFNNGMYLYAVTSAMDNKIVVKGKLLVQQ